MMMDDDEVEDGEVWAGIPGRQAGPPYIQAAVLGFGLWWGRVSGGGAQ